MTDRWFGPIDAAMSQLGFDPTQNLMGGSTSGRRGDPTLQGWSPGFGGVDPLMDQALPAMDALMAQQYGGQQAGGQYGAGWGSYTGTNSPVSTGGGEWAGLDRFNSGFSQASSQTGVPANLLKAVLAVEGSYGNDWGRAPVWIARGTYVNPFNGMLQSTAQANGYDWNRLQTDPAYAIWTSADVMKRLYAQYGQQWGWDGVVRAYFSGDPSPNGYADEFGNTTSGYAENVLGKWRQLDNFGSTAQSGWLGSAGGWGGDGGTGSSIVNVAKQYVGSPYVWGGTQPGGWDCSGMTWWLDQHYGGGQNNIPQGSHEQYTWAQQNGRMINNMADLKPGDLVFWFTQRDYNMSANNATHVGVYIGNGQMINALNPGAGTQISDMASFASNNQFLGGARMSWSSGPSYGLNYPSAGTPMGQQMTDPSQIMMALLRGEHPSGY